MRNPLRSVPDTGSDLIVFNPLLTDIEQHCIPRDALVLAELGFTDAEINDYKKAVLKSIYKDKVLGCVNMKGIKPEDHSKARGLRNTELTRVLEDRGRSMDDFAWGQKCIEEREASQAIG